MTDVARDVVPRSRTSWLLLVVWIALTVAMAMVLPRLPWQRAMAEIRRARLAWLFVAMLANFAILPLWAAEWALLVPSAVRMSFTRMFQVIAATAAVLNSLPFFAGEMSAVGLLMNRGALSSSAALSVVAMDQLLVGAAKLAVIGTAATVVPLPTWLRGGLLALALGVAALLIALVPFAHSWERVHKRLAAQRSSVRDTLSHIALWGSHLEALRDARRVWRLVALALAKKGAEVLAVLAVQIAFGLAPSLSTALLVVAALAVATALPVAPANLGVYEATVYGVYRYVGVSTELALGLAVIQHICFLIPPVATGYLTLTLGELLARRARL